MDGRWTTNALLLTISIKHAKVNSIYMYYHFLLLVHIERNCRVLLAIAIRFFFPPATLVTAMSCSASQQMSIIIHVRGIPYHTIGKMYVNWTRPILNMEPDDIVQSAIPDASVSHMILTPPDIKKSHGRAAKTPWLPTLTQSRPGCGVAFHGNKLSSQTSSGNPWNCHLAGATCLSPRTVPALSLAEKNTQKVKLL